MFSFVLNSKSITGMLNNIQEHLIFFFLSSLTCIYCNETKKHQCVLITKHGTSFMYTNKKTENAL